MRTIYLINWDNGGDACGTFPWEYATEAEADEAAESIRAENVAQGIWDEDGCCEVISREVPDEEDMEDEDEYAILQKAALSNGQP